MTSWPEHWITATLEAAEIQVTTDAMGVIRAWQNSTPLPPMTNNPIGMPAGATGAPRYLNTAYAIFPSMAAFYAAFKVFSKSPVGVQVVQAITSKTPYPQSWRSIASLGWPASKTETDYPAAILDLASQSFRNKVQATNPKARKTSGVVGGDPEVKAAVLSGMSAVHQAVAAGATGRDALREVIRKVM